MTKVFISGSISIKFIPKAVTHSLDTIIEKNIDVLVGDADGVDKKIQDYFSKKNYYNVYIYTIYEKPRNQVSRNFVVKKITASSDAKGEREKQYFKDNAMTADSDYSLVIWDGKSKGSYENILRCLKSKKKAKVYLTQSDDFLIKQKVRENDISHIFRENNGYSASEVVAYLQGENIRFFKNTKDLNNFLLKEKIIIKEDGVYKPIIDKDFFIIGTYRGRTSLKFNNIFIEWIEDRIKNNNQEQGCLL